MTRTTFKPLPPTRSLITSWNLRFMRSSVCCIFGTWLAGTNEMIAAQPLVVLQLPEVTGWVHGCHLRQSLKNSQLVQPKPGEGTKSCRATPF
jgi:hypothetical protein